MTKQEYDLLGMHLKKIDKYLGLAVKAFNNIDRDTLIDANADTDEDDTDNTQNTSQTQQPQQPRKLSTNIIKDPHLRQLAEDAANKKQQRQAKAAKEVGICNRVAPYPVIVRDTIPNSTLIDIYDEDKKESASLNVDFDLYQEIKDGFENDPDGKFKLDLTEEELTQIGENWVSEVSDTENENNTDCTEQL